jgi:hypothetical protein
LRHLLPNGCPDVHLVISGESRYSSGKALLIHIDFEWISPQQMMKTFANISLVSAHSKIKGVERATVYIKSS